MLENITIAKKGEKNDLEEGKNLAKEKGYMFSVYASDSMKKKSKCVFISHKKEDAKAAVAIGEYFTKVKAINIYLDQDDVILQEAVSKENDKEIVESIKRGLRCSTHLLCLISDQTRLSWWVPYEIGTAECCGVDISCLKLKDIADLPSFLKIQKVLLDINDFLQYVHELEPYGNYFTENKSDEISERERERLSLYLDGGM